MHLACTSQRLACIPHVLCFHSPLLKCHIKCTLHAIRMHTAHHTFLQSMHPPRMITTSFIFSFHSQCALTSYPIAEAHDVSHEVIKARDEAVQPFRAPVALHVYAEYEVPGRCKAGGSGWGVDRSAGRQASRQRFRQELMHTCSLLCMHVFCALPYSADDRSFFCCCRHGLPLFPLCFLCGYYVLRST